MKIFGLTKNSKIQAYLKEEYGLELLQDKDVPLFKKGNEYFLGGHRSFYSLFSGEEKEVEKLLVEYKSKYKNLKYLVSSPIEYSDSNLVNYVLYLGNILDVGKRFDVYDKKTRNLVKKSYKNNYKISIGDLPDQFYGLYESSMKRLGGISKSRNWFERISQDLKKDLVIFSLYDENKLIGSNFCLKSEKYIMLMLNVSLSEYWSYAINDRLYDELIKWSINNGFEYVDFGPSVRHDDSHNHFKAGFGAKEWYILDKHYGSFIYRFKAFWRQKRYNFRLKFKI